MRATENKTLEASCFLKEGLDLFDIGSLVSKAIGNFFGSFFDNLIKFFSNVLKDIMSTSQNVLDMPLVQNGVKYAQALALTLLVLKVMNEAYQTYILRQNGDPDADPAGLLVRTAQAVAVIVALPWIVLQIFTFGTKVSTDIANLSSGQAGIADWAAITTMVMASEGSVIGILCIILVVLMLIIAIQATIRGAELALLVVIGPILALNLTANNRSIWSSWFRQVIVVCISQAIQIFMLSGSLSLLSSRLVSGGGILLIFGWLWVTIKSPKFIQQFLHSTGFTGAVGGTAKQVGTMTIMRMMSKGG